MRSVSTIGPTTFGDAYTGSIRSVVVLANGYIDLGTWNCLTPFIGAGVGVAFNQLADFVDTGFAASGGSGIGTNPTETHLAWALHAGVSYAVTQNFSVELAYRYLNYGSITDTVHCLGSCSADSFKWDNLSSNDLMLGMRWRFPPATGIVVPPPRSRPAADRSANFRTAKRRGQPRRFCLLRSAILTARLPSRAAARFRRPPSSARRRPGRAELTLH